MSQFDTMGVLSKLKMMLPANWEVDPETWGVRAVLDDKHLVVVQVKPVKNIEGIRANVWAGDTSGTDTDLPLQMTSLVRRTLVNTLEEALCYDDHALLDPAVILELPRWVQDPLLERLNQDVQHTQTRVTDVETRIKGLREEQARYQTEVMRLYTVLDVISQKNRGSTP